MTKHVLFSGYAPVHFLCFLPVYERLKADPAFRVSLSGGFRRKEGQDISFELDGFYDYPEVDPSDIVDLDEIRRTDYDVLVNAHLSDSLFPRSARRTVQIYHGVSYKNYMVRDKALKFDVLCLPGRYHAGRYRERGLVTDDGPEIYVTGFAKCDALVDGRLDRQGLLRELDLDPSLPTVLVAPTGDKHNALELYGTVLIERLADGPWNVLVKPHDHPKNRIDWFAELAPFESERVRLVRALDVVPFLNAADLLVSDASSVITEYTLLDRPVVLLHVPRLLKRVVKRGGALDTTTYAHRLGPVIDDPAELRKVVEAQLSDSSAFGHARRTMADHVFHRPGSATDRVTAVIRYAAGLADLPAGIERLTDGTRDADAVRAA